MSRANPKPDPMANCPPAKWPTTSHILVMVVEYDSRPGTTELSDLIEKAREYGGVRRADLYAIKPSHVDLLD